ncbi:hypothetical protein ACFX13_024185 [Malus domestica]|uniref:uncharacterized protein LOC126609589 n=1 Tax=Malus sylvestris TaxID=3752 RepID=UPI000498C85F|nr:uncharacterized protein LOC103425904 [Malus domestica]XP_008362226.1 uncharacterized protein LOC103425904 [Malus domestica]XP_008362227.1 uncharacterized protein LOC103425904 [Malus domestica]XP_017185206.1 uncharacterized protein LOC103425904 [Malus domestica]XP_050133395.1 uncharacterized protein LOC126609589 [Malus sylvestris]XP_050133396.1 uncharacterized protein LOC126609589 [Malus sylvestris]XP_050133397.1 uncharacterized protein LOC126609589 [Malus sylvestris]
MAPRPRGRPRKRNTRMCAAIDAMKPMGFSENLVCDTVKELLEVYGEDGDTTGWPFIEEGAYSLLIETILEKQGGSENKDASLLDDAGSGNGVEASAAKLSITVFCPDSVAPRRLRPLYGWICRVGDDDNKLPVELAPVPSLEFVAALLHRWEKKVQVKVECEA